MVSVWSMNWSGGDIGVRESHQETVDGIWARDGSILNQGSSRGEREVGRLKRLHQRDLAIDWIGGCRRKRMASVCVPRGRKQNPLLIKQKWVYYQILGGNTIFGRAGYPHVEGSQAGARWSRARPGCITAWLEQNHCCWVLGPCETRNWTPKALPQLLQKNWMPPYL